MRFALSGGFRDRVTRVNWKVKSWPNWQRDSASSTKTAATTCQESLDYPRRNSPHYWLPGTPEFPAADAAASLSARWHEIQAMFVDDPRSSAEIAADLIDESVQALVASVREQQDSLLAAWNGKTRAPRNCALLSSITAPSVAVSQISPVKTDPRLPGKLADDERPVAGRPGQQVPRLRAGPAHDRCP
jgi:hypothetical protein